MAFLTKSGGFHKSCDQIIITYLSKRTVVYYVKDGKAEAALMKALRLQENSVFLLNWVGLFFSLEATIPVFN